MSDKIIEVCKRHGLTTVRKLSLGNVCDSVYMVVDTDNRQLVLKMGTESDAITEIRMNKSGYDNMDKCGLEFFRPEIVAYEDKMDYAMLLMEYCGEDFFTHVKKVDNPLSQYVQLTSAMEDVYHKSLQRGHKGKEMVIAVINKAKEQYENHVYMHLDPGRSEAEKIDKIDHCIDTGILKYYCFSNWDFTPEDAYLTSDGVKYSDPHEDILGIPIVDMACFAGVARAYNLPGAVDGYKIMKEFATNKISFMIGVDRHLALKLFFLGRLLQCLLSSRFRIKTDPIKAKAIFAEGKSYLDKIHSKN